MTSLPSGMRGERKKKAAKSTNRRWNLSELAGVMQSQRIKHYTSQVGKFRGGTGDTQLNMAAYHSEPMLYTMRRAS